MANTSVQFDVWPAGSAHVLPEKPILSDVLLCCKLHGISDH